MVSTPLLEPLTRRSTGLT